MNNYIKTNILALGAFQNSEMITKEKIDQILLLLLLFFFSGELGREEREVNLHSWYKPYRANQPRASFYGQIKNL